MGPGRGSAGCAVPVWKGKGYRFLRLGSDWKLDLAGLLEMGRSGSLIDEEGGNGSGADYKGYLRILIFGVMIRIWFTG